MSEAHADNELHGHHGLPYLAHHFETPVQQFDAAKLGMWLFLGQELLFFSGLFVAYLVFRLWYPDAWSVCSHELDWKMGTVNTLVLLFSSLTAVLAVRSAQTGNKSATGNYILITIACAFIFLVVKYFEYMHKIHAGLLPGHYFAPVAGHTISNVFPPGSAAYSERVLGLLHGHWRARSARDHRHRRAVLDLAAQQPRRVQCGVLHACRPGRAVLALGGLDLDLPVPLPLPDRLRQPS